MINEEKEVKKENVDENGIVSISKPDEINKPENY